jgi:hypothetical protein
MRYHARASATVNTTLAPPFEPGQQASRAATIEGPTQHTRSIIPGMMLWERKRKGQRQNVTKSEAEQQAHLQPLGDEIEIERAADGARHANARNAIKLPLPLD